MKARLFLSVSLVLALAGAGKAETADQVIARARAYLGGDQALNAISTIHFTGTLETTALVPDPADKTRQIEQPVRLPADIIFQKEYRQRITISDPKVVETTALDDYEGWQKRSNPLNPSQWTVTQFDLAQVKKLRANTWENLAFFAGIEKKGGSVHLDGDETVDGRPCAKLSFRHDADNVFVRFFDKATGRLVKTVTENGTEIREEGEMTVDGVRFPRKVINKSANGRTTTITFDRVVLNERVPASEFAFPDLKPN
ncbi:MAG TPA: hypothetical protein VL200_11705 [Lacunisphaera sp.]|jgi:hypothetical protein|nr:hypothetical protein [Lacunisphaera sp.]